MWTWLPGWDSLESVTRWHSFYEIAGIVCLAALVLAEVIAFQYGHRKDELVAVAEQATNKQRQDEAAAAEGRRKSEVDALQKQLTESDKKVADLQKLQQQRHLTDEQKRRLVAALSPFRGQAVTIASVMGNGETKTYRDDFVQVLDRAGWDHNGDSGILETVFSKDPVGIEVVVAQVNDRQGFATTGAQALIAILRELDLFDGGDSSMHSEVPMGSVQIRVGPRARPR